MKKFYIVPFFFRVNYCMENGNENINTNNNENAFVFIINLGCVCASRIKTNACTIDFREVK